MEKVCYIDDIKDQIKRIVNHSALTNEKIPRAFKGDECKKIREFILKVNEFSLNNDKKFVYRWVNILTIDDEMINVAWNFKSVFPIFYIGKTRMYGENHLDENFCMPAECPAELAAYLKEWKERHAEL